MEARRPYRKDLTGLRSIAVLLVVLFHAGVPGFGAGFVGVDVFFALSGFLIVRGLVDEIDETGRIDLVRFWTARARRLLPAATVAITVTLTASMLILSPFAWQDRLREAWAATFYWANIHFAGQSQSYFATGAEESPFLHFWSLSIEEQTYILLPLVIMAVVSASPRRERRAVTRMLWVVVGLSLVLSVMTVHSGRTDGTYFSSITRVWQLGSGGLLALHTGIVDSVVRRVTPNATRAIGFGLLAVSMYVVDPAAVYPGVQALLPVLGTLLVVAAGPHGWTWPLDASLSTWIGDRSYSWYLWHWPMIVLGESLLLHRTDVELGWSIAVGLAVLALGPAAASHRWVEQPVRTSEWLRASPRATVTGVGSAILLSTVVLIVLGSVSSATLEEPEMLALDVARTSYPAMPAECSTMDVETLLRDCAVGGADGGGRILLVGDSHMANWAPAFTQAGLDRGSEVIASLGGSCPIIGVGVSFDRWWCEQMRAGLWDAIDALAPEIVVVSHSANYTASMLDVDGSLIPPELGVDAWTTHLVAFVERLRDRQIAVVVVQPTPQHRAHPILCASLGRSREECAGRRTELAASIADVAGSQRDALWGLPGVTIFEPIDVVCPTSDCLFEEGGTLIWNDQHHITPSYSASKADVVAALLPDPGQGDGP